MPRIRDAASKSQPSVGVPTPVPPQLAIPIDDGAAMLALIQALIPLGLKAVEHALTQEVTALAGARYARDEAHPELVRWGEQAGSIYLADQKLPIQVPRVRDRAAGQEVALATYRQFQTPRALDVGLFRRVLGGLSCREYEAAAETVPAAFGLARSSVSRRFIRASARALRSLLERRLDDREWLVLLLDGKTFAADQLVIALGVTRTGEKRLLGLLQTVTENKTVCASFVRDLVERGFTTRRGCSSCSTGRRASAPRCATCSATRCPCSGASGTSARTCCAISRRRSSPRGDGNSRRRTRTRATGMRGARCTD